MISQVFLEVPDVGRNEPSNNPRQRHRHGTLMTGEAFAGAWLMTFPLAGAAIDDDGAVVTPRG